MTNPTYTKHTTHTDALDTLGSKLDADDPNERDAVHLAVFKCQAAHALLAGEDVGLNDEGKADTGFDSVGIVDPFLQAPVRPGEWFWLMVYPRQITTLRHVWEHPAFPPSTAPADAPIALQHVTYDRQLSIDWLTNWAEANLYGYEATGHYAGETDNGYGVQIPCTAYQYLMQHLEEAQTGDDYITFRGQEGPGGTIPSEMWQHYSVVTGVVVVDPPTYFSCTC